MRALAKLIGGVTPMAKCLGKSQSQISHLIGAKPSKNIGDKIAAQVEQKFHKPPGWLDRLHLSVQEVATLKNRYFKVPLIKAQVIPIISWNEVEHWQKKIDDYTRQQVEQIMVIYPKVGLQSYALKVRGGSMEAPKGVSFTAGTLIVVDPERVAKSGDYVVCSLANKSLPLFRQLIQEGHQRYLQPLNPRYPIIEVDNELIIHGVIRQACFNFS